MHRSNNKQKSFFMLCSSDLHKNYTAARRNKDSLWGKSEGTITIFIVAGLPYKHQDTLGGKKTPNNPQHTNPSICPKCLQYQDIEEVHLPHLHLSTLCTLIHGKCCSTAPELRAVTTRLTCTPPHKRCRAHTYGCTPAPGSCTWIQTHMAAVSNRWDTHPQPLLPSTSCCSMPVGICRFCHLKGHVATPRQR